MKSKYQQILEKEGVGAAKRYLRLVRQKAALSRKNNNGYFSNPQIASEMGKKSWQNRKSPDGKQTKESR